jgi:hypothetical protein
MMAGPLQSNISLANGGHSVQDHGPTFASPPIRHRGVISSSRPLSTATVTQKHQDKKLPQLPPDATTPIHQSIMSSTHVISEPEHPKLRKKTFFGMITLPGSRRSSISRSRPATPRSSTPDNSFNPPHQRKPDPVARSPPPQYRDLSPLPLDDTTNYRWNGDVAGQRSQPSFDISEPDSGLGIETVVAKTKLVTIVSSQPRPHLEPIPDAPIRASSTPPMIGHGVEKPRRTVADETELLRPQDPGTSGRTSPLMIFANSKMFGGKKGKERERSVDRGREARIATPAPAPENEKGRDSQNSNWEKGKSNTPNISGPMNLKVARGRVKHGSFDFERPLSTSVGYPVRSTRLSSSGSNRASSETDRNINGHGNGHLWNGPSSSTYPIQEERFSPTRSRSVRESGHHHQDRDRGQTKIRFADDMKGPQTRNRSPHEARSRNQHSSPPSKSTGRGLGLFKSNNPSTAQANRPYRPEGGSWGKNTSNRVGLGDTGYIDGLPSFGMSATSLHLNGDANGPPSRSNSPQIATIPMDRVTMKKHTGKGRSLDLGLELNWAPTRVREEAVMDFREMGVRSRWREEAEMKEVYRMKVLESFERVLGESGYAKFKECAHFSIFTFVSSPRLTLIFVRRCPAFRLEADTPRRTIRADTQGQATARYLNQRFGREEEAGTCGEARSCGPASAMITTPPMSISAMLTSGFLSLPVFLYANRYVHIATRSFNVYTVIPFLVGSLYVYVYTNTPLPTFIPLVSPFFFFSASTTRCVYTSVFRRFSLFANFCRCFAPPFVLRMFNL